MRPNGFVFGSVTKASAFQVTLIKRFSGFSNGLFLLDLTKGPELVWQSSPELCSAWAVRAAWNRNPEREVDSGSNFPRGNRNWPSLAELFGGIGLGSEGVVGDRRFRICHIILPIGRV